MGVELHDRLAGEAVRRGEEEDERLVDESQPYGEAAPGSPGAA